MGLLVTTLEKVEFCTLEVCAGVNHAYPNVSMNNTEPVRAPGTVWEMSNITGSHFGEIKFLLYVHEKLIFIALSTTEYQSLQSRIKER